MKLSELFEAMRTKTKTRTKVDLGDAYKEKKDQPLSKKDEPEEKPEKTVRGTSAEKTAKATSKVSLDDTALKHLANLHKNLKDTAGKPDDEVSTDVKKPSTEVMKPEDVEKVVGNALKVAGVENPDWHMVANLPGNMSRAIQTLGKALFASLTSTPTSKVTMIGNVGGQGPNTASEINAVTAYLKKHGKDLGPGEIDFEAVMPGYKAKVHNFSAEGVRFMLVKDDHGSYIYTWPDRTSITGKSQAAIGKK